MRNARLHQYPNAPATLLELGALLDQPENQHLTAAIGMQDSVYGGVIGSPGHECILFLSRRMGRYLSKAKEAFADATFVPAPLRPAAAQVYQIVCLEGHNVSSEPNSLNDFDHRKHELPLEDIICTLFYELVFSGPNAENRVLSALTSCS